VVTDVTEASMQVLRIALDWSGIETARAEHVNQALGQVGPQGTDGLPDGVYLTMGSAPPPPIIDGDLGNSKLIDKYKANGIKVNINGQFHMTRAMLGDLIKTLQVTADKYDEAVKLASLGDQGSKE
jgi:hypothetical protein